MEYLIVGRIWLPEMQIWRMASKQRSRIRYKKSGNRSPWTSRAQASFRGRLLVVVERAAELFTEGCDVGIQLLGGDFGIDLSGADFGVSEYAADALDGHVVWECARSKGVPCAMPREGLADVAKSVKIVYRKGSFFRAEDVLRNRVAERKNIECLFNTDLKKVAPVPNSDKIVVTTLDDKEIETDGLFVAIGHEANTDYLDEGIARDDMGRLIPDKLPKGTYVAGDVHSNIKMQIATAVGTGCTAAMEAIAYLNANE